MSLGTRTFFLTHNSQLIEAKANGKCSSVEMLIARNIDVRITWKSNFATCVYLSIFNKKYRELRIWHFHSAYDAAGVSGNSSFPGISASIFPSLPIGKFHFPSRNPGMQFIISRPVPGKRNFQPGILGR